MVFILSVNAEAVVIDGLTISKISSAGIPSSSRSAAAANLSYAVSIALAVIVVSCVFSCSFFRRISSTFLRSSMAVFNFSLASPCSSATSSDIILLMSPKSISMIDTLVIACYRSNFYA